MKNASDYIYYLVHYSKRMEKKNEKIFPDTKSEAKRKIWGENKRKEAKKEKWNFIVK